MIQSETHPPHRLQKINKQIIKVAVCLQRLFDKRKRFVPGKGARAHKAQLLPNSGRGLGYSNHVLFTQCCHANHTIDHYHDFQCCLAFLSTCLLDCSKRVQSCWGGGGGRRTVGERRGYIEGVI